MKKNLFFIALFVILVVGLSSCQDESNTSQDESNTSYLTTSKGWTLTAATSQPDYELLNGNSISSLFDGYLFDCELDDIIYFKEDSSQTLDPKNDLCEDGYTETTAIGVWSFNEDETKLNMQIPFFYDEAVETVDIVTLDKNTLKINYTFIEDDANPAKEQREYTFTLTYTRN